ncbi:hypothetical protein [Chelativorans sp. AA-79]|uniref:hypothetical protein n=1 Tax=Chelativorans sp. AA-79 TaxID=3028735 RepID=UPI0023F73F64|nr:hypothetical protein [Chelativorans sp. AA-79]WEX10336.1 hypothetical protein PVE73_05080 [Chelativorans sp. AA-79]
MRSAAHLNFKWTVRDTDTIRTMARRGKHAHTIALWFTRLGKPASADEIIRICDDMGVRLRKKAGEPA